MEEQNSEVITMTFLCPRPLRLAIRKAAAEHDLSMGEYIRQAIEAAIEAAASTSAQPAQEA